MLESCIVLLDCSEYMRNGDYVPTRLEAQQDAANLLVGAKTQAHAQSTVGVSAGTQVLVSPTREIGKILSALHSATLSIGGGSQTMQTSNSDLTAAVQVASLALKHRPEKNGGQRIVAFVGTPVESEVKALQKAGRQLKKNNIAIDIIAMGELEENEPKLRELVDAANGRSDEDNERTCHLVTIPAGVLPSDVLSSSPILGFGGAFAASAAAAAMGSSAGGNVNNFAEYGGVDPNMDPELAMALRVSMEEERVRQERAATAAAAANRSGGGENADSSGAGDGGGDATMGEAGDIGLSDEEALLQQALAMSMNENEPTNSAAATSEESKEEEKATTAEGMELDEDDDAAMQMALQMSMQHDTQEDSSGSGQQRFQDPSFVNELLGSAEGVDTNDPEIQEVLRKAKEKKDDESKKE
ncbi:hypothetical protein ACA910_014068 [Epithemia clementina (nom. ined.)]